ncbi:hypothetical protein [Haloarcula sp. 1CSR25-25]|jgi:hypothetical protein|uniref:hypothetical protein n=1 Tax=Haloarcula sp. 1CSR25-25 TaxID=2862545 RepID=UPI002895E21E|nr:hypothetical protein [Haloarcula sp. 1CSR25-25]MDT3437870.1 hypothetical protein [Haloarcula sp. 1CSR25-25]
MTDTPPPEPQEITEAIQSVLYEFTQERDDITANDPITVNSGYCREFAEEVLDYLGYPSEITQYDAWYVHSWIEFDGQHYDAEHPRGVKHPREFPIWERVTADEYEMAVSDCDILNQKTP